MKLPTPIRAIFKLPGREHRALRRSAVVFDLLAILSATFLAFTISIDACAADLTIGVSSTPLATPFYVADKQGFFAQEGLDVTIKECSGGKLCLSRALGGEVHLATASELPIMFSSFVRKDFSILATFASTHRDVKLLTRKSAGIKAPKDLAGKRIGLVRGAAGEYFVGLVLLTYGVDPSSITLVDLTADAMETTLRNRAVDVLATFEPRTYTLMQALKHDGFIIPVPAIYTLTFNLVGLNSVVNERQTDILKLLRALDKSVQYIQANPQQAQAVLLERLRVDASFLDWAWAEYRFELTLNQSLLTTLESQANWAIRENMVAGKTAPDYLRLVDPRYLAKVRPTFITLVK